MISGMDRGGLGESTLAFRYAEPVGSVRPKFPTMDNLNGLSVTLGGNMPLLCPAQGFPVPSHRYGTLGLGARNNSRGFPNDIYSFGSMMIMD